MQQNVMIVRTKIALMKVWLRKFSDAVLRWHSDFQRIVEWPVN
jgi:hypothetical protein